MSLGVVIVHGARVTRFNVPRWVAWGALGLQTALVAAAVGLCGTPGLVRGEIDALRQRADAERRLAETFQARVAAVTDELAEWKTLHTKIWKAFGDPETAPMETADQDGPRRACDLGLLVAQPGGRAARLGGLAGIQAGHR